MKEYEKKRFVKRVSFNLTSDRHLLDFANNLDDFSNWVKGKIMQELQNQEKTNEDD